MIYCCVRVQNTDTHTFSDNVALETFSIKIYMSFLNERKSNLIRKSNTSTPVKKLIYFQLFIERKIIFNTSSVGVHL